MEWEKVEGNNTQQDEEFYETIKLVLLSTSSNT